jgi:iron complex transport system permease protein
MLLLLLLLIVASLLLDFVLGPSGMSLHTLWQTLTNPGQRSDRNAGHRLGYPHALRADGDGRRPCSGLAGAEMQTINNPLASPFTLGVSSAAAFGAALAIVLGIGIPGIPGQWFTSANAFLFALLAALLLDGITRWTQVATSGVILIWYRAGVYLNALVSMLQFVANEDTLQGWCSGRWAASIAPHGKKWGSCLPSGGRDAAFHAQCVEADRAAPRRRPGDQLWHQRPSPASDHAAAHQHSVGAVAAFVGPIGFIGLVAPHIAPGFR